MVSSYYPEFIPPFALPPWLPPFPPSSPLGSLKPFLLLLFLQRPYLKFLAFIALLSALQHYFIGVSRRSGGFGGACLLGEVNKAYREGKSRLALLLLLAWQLVERLNYCRAAFVHPGPRNRYIIETASTRGCLKILRPYKAVTVRATSFTHNLPFAMTRFTLDRGYRCLVIIYILLFSSLVKGEPVPLFSTPKGTWRQVGNQLVTLDSRATAIYNFDNSRGSNSDRFTLTFKAVGFGSWKVDLEGNVQTGNGQDTITIPLLFGIHNYFLNVEAGSNGLMIQEVDVSPDTGVDSPTPPIPDTQTSRSTNTNINTNTNTNTNTRQPTSTLSSTSSAVPTSSSTEPSLWVLNLRVS